MRKYTKILSVFLVILLIGGVAFAQRGYQRSPGAGDILGQGLYASEPHRSFRFVRYAAATLGPDAVSLATTDAIVVWDGVSDDGKTVTTTTTSGDNKVAGIVRFTIQTSEANTGGATVSEDAGRRNWGFIQTYGLSKAKIQVGGWVGNSATFGTSTEAGSINEFTFGTATAGVRGVAGVALNASASGNGTTTTAVFLKCE